MRFEVAHRVFANDTITCDENSLPEWMKHNEFLWWTTMYVLKLQVGESIESDFHKIIRIR